MAKTDRLLEAAKIAMGNAYAPYSNFKVGCAVETKTGEIFNGCNVENSSYGATICAERVAVSAAVAAGSKSYKRLVLISVNPEPITPCGICRQFLHEILGPKLQIICYGSDGKKSITYRITDLLPSGFTKADIRSTR